MLLHILRKETLGIVLLAVLAYADCSKHKNISPFDLAFRDEILAAQKSGIALRAEPVDKQVIFQLYTRRNPSAYDLKLDDLSLRASTLNLKRPTKFIIHGFMNDGDSGMNQKIKDNLIKAEDVNVIIVDWGKLAKGINYFSTAKKTKEVGEYLARLMDFLSSRGGDRRQFHLIGHSLGAHVAGYAGAHMRTGKPGRISGLDPAKPEFNKVAVEKRLDPSDADFVDVIHTCGGWLGIMEPVGHADFYPNGGKNVQPGCHSYDFGKCSHSRAHQFFAESIFPHHVFATKHCTAFDKLKDGCRNTHVRMGYHTDTRARGIFYSTTTKDVPFAVANF